ncbi:unnamed protein product [Candidula unifasciata]|uniref:Uncharacterized protein n=1 Tax=Candidula unifasciata TaxID=100452 RepID=A0A8S3ZNG5_9EUPU|nr:unnamed protein product [Candidula unifasciata]
MGCAFFKLCPEWGVYKTASGKLGTSASESSPLLNGDSKKKIAENEHLSQTPGKATRENHGNVIEQSEITKDFLEQEQSPQLSAKSAENINTSFNSDKISENDIASLSSSLASNCPSTLQAGRQPDFLSNTSTANDCSEDAITHKRSISTDETETSVLSTAKDYHFPDFQTEQVLKVLKEYQDLVEECAVLKTRVQAIEAEIEMERMRKSEQLDNLQKQFAEVNSKYHFLQKKSNLMLFLSGIPLLVLVFAVMLIIYPVLGTVTSAPS